MSFLETSHVAEGPFGSSDPLADLIEFFQTNGYEVVDSTSGPRPSIMTWNDQTEGDGPQHESEESTDTADSGQAKDVSDAAAEEGPADDAAEAAADDAAEPADDAPEAPETVDDGNDAEDGDQVETPETDSGDLDGSADAETSDGIDESSENEEILLRVQLRRGKQGASIWSSNMAELLSDVDLKVIGNSIRVAYKIETTFQHFNDDDNAFWAQEAKQALRMAKGGKATDWRDNEEIRVSRQQKDIIMIGVQLAILAAILVAVAYFAFNRA